MGQTNSRRGGRSWSSSNLASERPPKRESRRPRVIDDYSDADGSETVIVNRGAPGYEPRAPRLEVRLVVSIESESNFYAGFTENLSESGVFVATSVPLTIGSSVDLWIYLPHKEPIRARGTVRWQRRDSNFYETGPGVGIRFDRLSAEDTTRIHKFAESRAPMFFDDDPPESFERKTLKP